MSKRMSSSSTTQINNWIGGKLVPPRSNRYLRLTCPIDSSSLGSVAISCKSDVADAVAAAKAAFPAWRDLTVKARAGIMMNFHRLVKENAQELAELIVKENGKNITEALADVAKGNETVEYACSLPQLIAGTTLRVSSSVSCQDKRSPLGVIASVVPFNFPFMVPMWTLPIALVTGNTMILKPSDKVPATMTRVLDLLAEAGVPDGVCNFVHGGGEAVEALIDHEDVSAVTFVGSSPIARIVSTRCNKLHKRCIALGGAKNHLIALPDCNLETTARDVVVSSMGCAGQRCMAASVLLLVGKGPEQERLLERVVEIAGKIEPGVESGKMGPVITKESRDRIRGYIARAKEGGAEILLDGMPWATTVGIEKGGNWVGPTVIRHSSAEDAAMREEIFGPVLSVYSASSWEEAVAIENSNPFGNAACIYTTNGGNADWFTDRFRAAMLGVNVGIPVPREPFSFGGLYGTLSKYGDMDITGDGAIEFFTNRIKITSKWSINPSNLQHEVGGGSTTNGVSTTPTDHANFNGQM